MLELIALYLAGLSFFFSGVSGISENLRQISSQHFRVLLTRATNHPAMAGTLGMALGVVTQSTSVVAFILSGMIASGLLPLNRALIVLACSNIGTAVLVFIAATDLHLSILFLIGISGLILAFKPFFRWRPGVAGLLSLGMVFFGLDLMKQAVRPLSTSGELTHVGKFFAALPGMAFFLGMVMRSVIHSSAAVAAIAITLNKDGLMSEFTAMMTIAGLGMGTAVATYFLSSNLRGVPKQIALYQTFINLGASLLVGTLLVVEHMTGLPGFLALAHHLGSSMAARMAYMYLLFNIVIATISIISLPWAPKMLVKLSPPTPEEDLSRPMYLLEEALQSPETALDLVALEQGRIMRALQQYLEAARGNQSVSLVPLHGAAGLLRREIAGFLQALVKRPIDTRLATRVISFQRKEETLRALEENVFLFAQTLQHRGEVADVAEWLVEGLDTILLTATEALQSKDIADVDLLVQLTADRGLMMERLRDRHRLDNGASVGDVSALHYVTTLFERNIWLLRQLALWMREDALSTEAA